MSIKSSVDQTELRKFSNIAGSWWQKDGEFKMLHQINPLRLSYITNKIKDHFTINDNISLLSNLEILDVGCGGGLISCELSRLEANVTGIDAIQTNIDIATLHAQKENLQINYLKSTIEELVASTSKQYDVILCLEVMEHIDNPSYFAENLANLLKPNGMIIISTINRTVKAYILAILMAEYLLGWVPRKTHNHSKFLKPSDLHAIFSKNNLILTELKGLTYNLANRIWQLTEDIEVNYFAYLIKGKQ